MVLRRQESRWYPALGAVETPITLASCRRGVGRCSGVFEETLAGVLHGSSSEHARECQSDEGKGNYGPAAGWRSEQRLDPSGHVGGEDAQSGGGNAARPS